MKTSYKYLKLNSKKENKKVVEKAAERLAEIFYM